MANLHTFSELGLNALSRAISLHTTGHKGVSIMDISRYSGESPCEKKKKNRKF